MIMRWPFQSYQATYAIAALVIVGGILRLGARPRSGVVVAGGVAAPGGAGVGDLACGALLVKPECVGDDRGRDS